MRDKDPQSTREVHTSNTRIVEGATCHDVSVAKVNTEALLALAKRATPTNENDLAIFKARQDHEIAMFKLKDEREERRKQQLKNRSSGEKFIEDWLPGVIGLGILCVVGAVSYLLSKD